MQVVHPSGLKLIFPEALKAPVLNLEPFNVAQKPGGEDFDRNGVKRLSERLKWSGNGQKLPEVSHVTLVVRFHRVGFQLLSVACCKIPNHCKYKSPYP